MPKCDFCEEEVLFPFVCRYCGSSFCSEHRLPENHQCRELPKEPRFWYQKRMLAEKLAPRSDEVCPKCGSTVVSVSSFEEAKVNYQCERCRFKWSGFRSEYRPMSERERNYIQPKKERRKIQVGVPVGKIFCVLLMIGVAFAFIYGIDWALTVNLELTVRIGELTLELGEYLPIAFVLAMCHELLHALAWWFYGYSAIPIPILIPPFLGITIGEKPKSRLENVVISLAPILLTIAGLLAYDRTGKEQYFSFGMLNLFGMSYDIFSIFIR